MCCSAYESELPQFRFPYTNATYNNPQNLWVFAYVPPALSRRAHTHRRAQRVQALPLIASVVYMWCSGVELVELHGLGHYVLVHHEGRLEIPVALPAKEVEAVRCEGLVQIDTVVREEVSSVAGNLGT